MSEVQTSTCYISALITEVTIRSYGIKEEQIMVAFYK